jgi:hypothetical protein
MGCHRRAGQPIEHGHIVGLWGAAQVLKRQRLELLEAKGRRDFVIRERELLGGERQRVV